MPTNPMTHMNRIMDIGHALGRASAAAQHEKEAAMEKLEPPDLSELLELALQCEHRGGAIGPPLAEDAPAMDPHEWEVRKAMIALTELPEGDHEARGHQWEHIAELCFSAADKEWRLSRGGEPGRQG